MKIGVFDSGFGGLTIFKEIKKALPEYDYIYLGDSARAPYGNHSHDVIYKYVEEAVQFLFDQDCQLVILACNSASAQALPELQQGWLAKHYPDRRVLGVIRPIAEVASEFAKDHKIGVIGTRATINSGAYEAELLKLVGKEADIVSKACPLLVPLIEEGFDKRPETKRILKYYLRPLRQKGVDVLIQGCTHYQLLHDTIEAFMGKRVKVLDVAKIVADKLVDYLNRHPEIDEKLEKNGETLFLTTDKDNRFDELASKFYGEKVDSQVVNL